MDNTTENNVVHEDHPKLYELFAQYFIEFFGLLKYIFQDVFLGLDP